MYLKFEIYAYLKIRKFIIPLIYAKSEIQTGIAAVDYFMISELNKFNKKGGREYGTSRKLVCLDSLWTIYRCTSISIFLLSDSL